MLGRQLTSQGVSGYDGERFADVTDFDNGSAAHITTTDGVEGDAIDGGDEASSTAREGETAEASTTFDFGGEEFRGDLLDQISVIHPDHDKISFGSEGHRDAYPPGLRQGIGQGGGDKSGRAVYADIVMPYGDPHGKGEQGIMSIPVKISVGDDDDDDDDDDDSDEGGSS